MTHAKRAPLPSLSTGVPGLDDVLGGGLPEYSFNLIAGEPGSGKTTLAHVIANEMSAKCASKYEKEKAAGVSIAQKSN